MAPGALGGLSQVMPSLPQDTCQGCQPADPTFPEQSRIYTVHYHRASPCRGEDLLLLIHFS